MFAWAKTGLFYSWFGKVNARTGIPRGALWLSVILSIIWILPAHLSFWQGLVGNVTSATVLTYMIGPISLASLRKTSPSLNRPFRLKASRILAPLAFIASSLIIFWSGWVTNLEIIGITLVSLILYFAFVDREEYRNRIRSDWKSGAWLVVYFIFHAGDFPVGELPIAGGGKADHRFAVGQCNCRSWRPHLLLLGGRPTPCRSRKSMMTISRLGRCHKF